MDEYHEMNCLTCDDWLDIIPTAYGERATCRRCKIRWTRIRRDYDPFVKQIKVQQAWIPEKYNPMNQYD